MIDLAQPDLTFALAAVREAIALARAVQAGLQIDGVAKPDRSPVTVADFGAQALIARAFERERPEAALVGEESAGDLDAALLGRVAAFVQPHAPEATPDRVRAWIARGAADPGDRFWTLDPIDGTKGFLRRAHYAIALALIEDGAVQLAILGCPSLAADGAPEPGPGAIGIAQRGAGAWLLPISGGTAPRRLRVSDCRDAAAARVFRSFEASHTNPGQIEAFEQRLGVAAPPVGMDSQAKYAALAAGHGELLLRFLSPKQPDYREKIWDQAAGALLLEEAGGVITDLHGRALDFGQGRTLARNVGVFASNGPLHAAGLEAIAAVCNP